MARPCLLSVLPLLACAVSCYRAPEMTLSEIEAARASLSNELIEKTVRRPNTDNHFVPPGTPATK